MTPFIGKKTSFNDSGSEVDAVGNYKYISEHSHVLLIRKVNRGTM